MAAAQFSADDRTAIEALHSAWLNAELRGETSTLLQWCTEEAVWLPPGEEPVCGKTSILRWLEGRSHAAVRRIDIDGLAIAGMGSFAWKAASFRTTLDGAGVVSGSHGWLLRRDGNLAWRIAVITWTIDQRSTDE